jgi:mannose-6-phosphate isomerase-like protein (cupin superfamily)
MKLLRHTIVLSSVVLLASIARGGESSVVDILRTYVDDYARDPSAHGPITFGIRITGEGGGEWRVTVHKKDPGDSMATALLDEGFPKEPTFFFRTDADTLRKIDSGRMNALTAMAAAFSTDETPLDIDMMPGFKPGKDFVSVAIPLTFHFWTRGFPERVPFGTGLTRETHGANAAIMYYQPGLRSAWVQIAHGQHANADPRSQTNPFSSMLIGLSGECKAKIDGKTSDMKAGEMMFIPANITHEFWNPHEKPFEAILLMFGEGA